MVLKDVSIHRAYKGMKEKIQLWTFYLFTPKSDKWENAHWSHKGSQFALCFCSFTNHHHHHLSVSRALNSQSKHFQGPFPFIVTGNTLDAGQLAFNRVTKWSPQLSWGGTRGQPPNHTCSSNFIWTRQVSFTYSETHTHRLTYSHTHIQIHTLTHRHTHTHTHTHTHAQCTDWYKDMPLPITTMPDPMFKTFGLSNIGPIWYIDFLLNN